MAQENKKFSPDGFFGYMKRLEVVARLSHWKVTSDPAHRALDEFELGLHTLLDEMVENYQGFASRLMDITVPECKAIDMLPVLQESGKYIAKQKEHFPPDVQNLLDEVIGLINKCVYKLRFLK